MNHQTIFPFMSHGGKRKGAGRPKLIPNEPAHHARPKVNEKIPFHGSVKMHEKVPTLRSPKMCLAILRGIQAAKKKSLAVTQFAIESNHIHFIGEARNNEALSRGMMSLTASITWALKKIMRYFGKVFRSRYFVHALKTPREMRNALKYVIFNHAKHLNAKPFADVYSSTSVFRDIRAFLNSLPKQSPWRNEIKMALSEPRSWLQTIGWKKI